MTFSTSQSTPRTRFSLLSAVGLVACGLVLEVRGQAPAPYGLDQAAPLSAFLHGAMPRSTPATPGGGDFIMVEAFPNLRFTDPIDLKPEPGTNRLSIAERPGRLYAVENAPASTTKTLLLDIASKVQNTQDNGIMSFAFHPQFGQAGSPNRGYLYMYYMANGAPGGFFARLSRFTRADGATSFDPASEQILINQLDTHQWHGGGSVVFGPDGFLYLAFGDEGYQGTGSIASTQRIDDRLFGGVIRIDVDSNLARSHPIRRQPLPAGISYTQNYCIPNDNPFLSETGAFLEEFWCIGIRSPHRMSFDPVTGRLWEGDVGYARQEEINLIERGANYQWPYLEGVLPGFREKPTPLIGFDKTPYFYYDRDFGTCVIGGFVYRGKKFPSLLGRYIFGDNTFGTIHALSGPDNAPVPELLTALPPGALYSGLSSFGLDHDGEIYALKLGTTHSENGAVYKLENDGNPTPDGPPFLSYAGFFEDLATLAPRAGVIPYDLVQPFWSDGAIKRRWMAIPSDGLHNTAEEKITFSPQSPWVFPTGSVLIKHFDLPVDDLNPAITKRIETRLLVAGEDGIYYGLTYKWFEDGSDAVLLTEAESRDVQIRQVDGSFRTQSWYYPSRQQCMSCHTPNAGSVLGPNTHQLNGNFLYPTTGRTDNQLRTLNHLGIFSPALDESAIAGLPKAAPIADESATLEDRARTYLDANCAYCHQAGGSRGHFDARFSLPLSQTGLIDGIVDDNLGVSNARTISPKNLAQSLIHSRVNRIDEYAMPPLAKSVIDQKGAQLLERWIQSLPVSWEKWQTTTPGAGGAPGANLDGDAYDDLAEFALGTDPASGVAGASGLRLAVAADTVSASYRRPIGLPGLTYVVEASSDLLAWIDVPAGLTTVTQNSDGTETIDLAQPAAIPGLSATRGYLRLRFNLASPVAVSRTVPVGWSRTALHAGYQTFGASLLQPALFGGKVTAVNGAAGTLTLSSPLPPGLLSPDKPCFIEFVDGPAEGQRFDLDPAASTGNSIAALAAPTRNTLPALPANVTGSRITLRPHRTLGGLFDIARFAGALNPGGADQLHFFDGQAYSIYYALDLGSALPSQKRWALVGGSPSANQGLRIVAPGVGCFVRRAGASSLSVFVTGEVRANRFVQPLVQGSNLIAEGFPTVQSPNQRGLLASNGFLGASSPNNADRLYLWAGETGTGNAFYNTYFYLDLRPNAPLVHWTALTSSNLSSQSDTLLFPGDRAAFLTLKSTAKPAYSMAAPWSP